MSTVASKRRPPTPLNLPKGKLDVEVVLTPNGSLLVWQPLWFCQQYNIKYGPETTGGEHKIVENVTKTSFLIPVHLLEHEVTYFAVQGWNDVGPGEWSGWIAVKKIATPTPVLQEAIKKGVSTWLVVAIMMVLACIASFGWIVHKTYGKSAKVVPTPLTHTNYVEVEKYITNTVVAWVTNTVTVTNVVTATIMEVENKVAPPPPTQVSALTFQMAHPYIEGKGWTRVALVVDSRDPKSRKDVLEAPDGAPVPVVTGPNGPIAVEKLKIRRGGNNYFPAWGTRNPPPWAIPDG